MTVKLRRVCSMIGMVVSICRLVSSSCVPLHTSCLHYVLGSPFLPFPATLLNRECPARSPHFFLVLTQRPLHLLHRNQPIHSVRLLQHLPPVPCEVCGLLPGRSPAHPRPGGGPFPEAGPARLTRFLEMSLDNFTVSEIVSLGQFEHSGHGFGMGAHSSGEASSPSVAVSSTALRIAHCRFTELQMQAAWLHRQCDEFVSPIPGNVVAQRVPSPVSPPPPGPHPVPPPAPSEPANPFSTAAPAVAPVPREATVACNPFVALHPGRSPAHPRPGGGGP